MIEFEKRASENTVKGFIAAAKSIAGTNISARDEATLSGYLTARLVTGKGIEVTITPRKVAAQSSEFSASYSRRRRR